MGAMRAIVFLEQTPTTPTTPGKSALVEEGPDFCPQVFTFWKSSRKERESRMGTGGGATKDKV